MLYRVRAKVRVRAHELGERDGAAAVCVHLREAHRLLGRLAHVAAEAAAANLPGAAIGLGRPRALHQPQRQPELARVELTWLGVGVGVGVGVGLGVGLGLGLGLGLPRRPEAGRDGAAATAGRRPCLTAESDHGSSSSAWLGLGLG